MGTPNQAPVAEVPLHYYATVDVARELPEEIAAGYVDQFADRCITALGLDPNRAAPKAVRAIVQELPQEPADWTRRFAFTAKNVTPAGDITVALMRPSSNFADRRLATQYPGDVMRVVTRIGGMNGEAETREFHRTGIDLTTGDHIYREQPETR